MARIRLSSTSLGSPGLAGRGAATLFFMLFLLGGLLVLAFLGRELLQSLRARTWTVVRCEVLESGVRETDGEGRRSGKFGFAVRFRYEFDGQAYESTRHRLKPETFSDYGKAARLVARYEAGSAAVCYVNPREPGEAILEQTSLMLAPFLLIPLVFVGVGGGGIVMVWRRAPAGVVAAGPISERAARGWGGRFLVGFFLIFMLVGGGIFYGFVVRPVLRILEAKTWPAVDCTVVSSAVRSHSGDEGTTYSVDILYVYEFGGREHKSNRYHFLGGSSSGYAGKRAIVDRHSPGTRTVCYVNPRDPTEAVLQRGFVAELWFGLIPLVFMGVGAGGLFYSLRQGRRGPLGVPAVPGLPAMTDGRRSWRGGAVLAGGGDAEAMELEPQAAPWVKLAGALFVAVFWNGIVSVFVFQAVQGWRSGRPDWFLTVFLVPFVVIGLGMLAAVGYFFLALFNPRVRVRVTPGRVRLGGGMRVEWRFTGRVAMLQRVRVWLEGREEATYRRGTKTSTDRSTFVRLQVANASARDEMRLGAADVTIPAETMHSFESANNKIVWMLRVQGEIARWPDVDEGFRVVVVPGLLGSRGPFKP
jgi:hypothetical protein